MNAALSAVRVGNSLVSFWDRKKKFTRQWISMHGPTEQPHSFRVCGQWHWVPWRSSVSDLFVLFWTKKSLDWKGELGYALLNYVYLDFVSWVEDIQHILPCSLSNISSHWVKIDSRKLSDLCCSVLRGRQGRFQSRWDAMGVCCIKGLWVQYPSFLISHSCCRHGKFADSLILQEAGNSKPIWTGR